MPTIFSAPAAASPTAGEAVPLQIVASLEPPQPQVGAEFVLRLDVSNTGTRDARGVYIATSGPWDRYTVVSVVPNGEFGRDAAGWHIVSRVVVPPGETRRIEVHARADSPSDEQLTFAVREAEPGDLS